MEGEGGGGGAGGGYVQGEDDFEPRGIMQYRRGNIQYIGRAHF
jgi:hypothetical protein